MELTDVDFLETRKIYFVPAGFRTPYLILGLPFIRHKKKLHFPLNDHEKGAYRLKRRLNRSKVVLSLNNIPLQRFFKFHAYEIQMSPSFPEFPRRSFTIHSKVRCRTHVLARITLTYYTFAFLYKVREYIFVFPAP
jgi:hypothetical protein